VVWIYRLWPAILPIDLRVASKAIEDAIADKSDETGSGTVFPMVRIE
jgi:hypothetical protein